MFEWLKGGRVLTLIVLIAGSHVGLHCWGILTSPFCRTSRPDPRGGKGAKTAAKAPTGDDTTTAMATSGAASIARMWNIIIKVVGAGARAEVRRCCPP